MDGLNYGIQRLVHHLAEPAESHRTGRSQCRGKTKGGTVSGSRVSREHHAVNPDAIFHGIGAEPLLISSARETENGVFGPRFFFRITG